MRLMFIPLSWALNTLKRCVGDGDSVKSVPNRTVSVENVGWSEAEVLMSSLMHEVSNAHAITPASQRNLYVFREILFIVNK